MKGKKGGGGKGGKEAWKGYGAKGYTFIPSAGQWKAAAGSPGVPLPGPRQWAHPLQPPGGGKGLSWFHEQPAGYMLSMLSEVKKADSTTTTRSGGGPYTSETSGNVGPCLSGKAHWCNSPLECSIGKNYTDANYFALLEEDYPELEPPGPPATTTTTTRSHGAQATQSCDGPPQPTFTTTRRNWRRARKTSLATFLGGAPCTTGCCVTTARHTGSCPTTARPSGPRMLSAFTEKPKQSLRPLHSSGGDEWEVIDAILDSGASVTVIPPHVAAGHPVQESAASRAGVQYEVANGDEIPNLGEKLFAVVTE